MLSSSSALSLLFLIHTSSSDEPALKTLASALFETFPLQWSLSMRSHSCPIDSFLSRVLPLFSFLKIFNCFSGKFMPWGKGEKMIGRYWHLISLRKKEKKRKNFGHIHGISKCCNLKTFLAIDRYGVHKGL